MSRAARGQGREHGVSRLAYPSTLVMLGVALAFPVGLMVFNPTLIFDRGWEQYAGTTFYFVAVFILIRELFRLWSNERAFGEADDQLQAPEAIDPSDRRLLPSRIRGLAGSGGVVSVAQLVELNREASALDQEQTASRFTLSRYILYLLPVIGFIGTVEGISKALMNISKVLPMVKELDGFLSNLTGVTHALNIAFDSTLLALFLSAALMFVQTLVHRRAEDLLARVDRWVVEHVLPKAGRAEAEAEAARGGLATLGPQLQRIEQALEGLADRLGPHVDRFAAAIDRLNPALEAMRRGSEAIGHLGDELGGLAQASEAARKGAASLARIEALLTADQGHDEQLDQIRRGLDRSVTAIEGLAGQFANAFERNSRTHQEQLARTLGSLKDALDMLNVSMEQANALYRSIVKKMLPTYAPPPSDELAA